METPQALLRRYGLWPRKSLGQNFLVDPSVPSRIAAFAELSSADTVLEVGAGLGALTEVLARMAGRVLAVETDRDLVVLLQERLGQTPNVEVVGGDILELDPAPLLGIEAAESLPLWGSLLPCYHVVANLPYYITSAVVRHLLEASVRPLRMVVTVQREVGQRMTAAPGEMSLLSVSTQFYAQPRLCMRIKPGAFYPAPQVESVVVRLDSYATPPVAVDDIELFFRVVRAGFSQKRKQLHNALASALHLPASAVIAALESAAISPARRAETLSLPEWAELSRSFAPALAG